MRIEMKTTMGVGRVVRLVDIDLFDGSFHSKILMEDNRAKGEPVTDVGTGFTAE
uniref:Uncharacterized protein n=1 Tax=Romanomermis culicivorax TaxID=13658 RepID=A0A915KFU8_ROMCU